jgi:hypothetical protein
MSTIGKVPTNLQPQFSQLMVIARNLDAGRSPMAGARQTLPGVDRYVMEEARRAPVANWTDSRQGRFRRLRASRRARRARCGRTYRPAEGTNVCCKILRIASERPVSFSFAQLSTRMIISRGSRKLSIGSRPPVGGLPRFFGLTDVDFFMAWSYHKGKSASRAFMPRHA